MTIYQKWPDFVCFCGWGLGDCIIIIYPNVFKLKYWILYIFISSSHKKQYIIQLLRDMCTFFIRCKTLLCYHPVNFALLFWLFVLALKLDSPTLEPQKSNIFTLYVSVISLNVSSFLNNQSSNSCHTWSTPWTGCWSIAEHIHMIMANLDTS